MFLYEHDRSKIIILRLRALSSLIRLAAVGFWVAVLAALFAILNALILPETWWVGSLLGALLGALVGSVASITAVAVIEWMSQMLVAHGEIIEALKVRTG